MIRADAIIQLIKFLQWTEILCSLSYLIVNWLFVDEDKHFKDIILGSWSKTIDQLIEKINCFLTGTRHFSWQDGLLTYSVLYTLKDQNSRGDQPSYCIQIMSCQF